jgi:hypothetical protein
MLYAEADTIPFPLPAGEGWGDGHVQGRYRLAFLWKCGTTYLPKRRSVPITS